MSSLELSNVQSNMTLARDLMVNSDYQGALVYLENTLRFIAKYVKRKICQTSVHPWDNWTSKHCHVCPPSYPILKPMLLRLRRHVRNVQDPYTLGKWQDCRKRVAAEADTCKDIIQELGLIRGDPISGPGPGPAGHRMDDVSCLTCMHTCALVAVCTGLNTLGLPFHAAHTMHRCLPPRSAHCPPASRALLCYGYVCAHVCVCVCGLAVWSVWASWV